MHGSALPRRTAGLLAGGVRRPRCTGFLFLAFSCFQTWEVRQRTVPPAPPGFPVDVFVTTYDEDVDLLRQTVRGALRMRYPHRTLVVDARQRAEVGALCDELGCEYVAGNAGGHTKAGTWNDAFARTSGAVIAVFDAEHVPHPDFLERTLGYFADPTGSGTGAGGGASKVLKEILLTH